MKKAMLALLSLALLALAATAALGQAGDAGDAKVGVIMPNKDETRWIVESQRIADKLEEYGIGAETLFSAEDSETELANAEALIAAGVKVLILCPVDVDAADAVAEKARAAGVQLIDYERLIRDTEAIDWFIAFNPIVMGEVMGKVLVDSAIGKANSLYLYAGGATDPDQFHFLRGAWSKLAPKIADGTFIIRNCPEAQALKGSPSLTYEQAKAVLAKIATGDDPAKAKALVARDLAAVREGAKAFAYILAPSDAMARALAAAFTLDPAVKRYFVTGQGAEVESVQAILDGKQSMTVLKDTRVLAVDAAAIAKAMIDGLLPPSTHYYDNGTFSVPSRPSALTVITKDNAKALLVDTGYYSADKFRWK